MDENKSYLRKREAWFRKFPLHDAHVRAFCSAYPPTKRALWSCPRCGKIMRTGDVPRDADGKHKRHCGCRTGVPSRLGTGKWKKMCGNARSSKYKRMARMCSSHGFKEIRRDAHVKERNRMMKEAEWMFRLILAKKPFGAPVALSGEEIVKRRRQKDSEHVATLSDKYVRHLIVKSMPIMKAVHVPHSLIEVERARLMIVREIKYRRDSNG